MVIGDNSEIILLILHKKKTYFCDPSLEPSRQDGSNEVPQYMFFMEK